jgi:flagellar FliL protein
MAGKEDEEAKEKKGGRKKLLIIIVAAVVVLLGGGVGAYFMFFKSSGTKSTATPEPTPSSVVVADAITVNLSDGHYLKIGIALQTTTDAAEVPDDSKALDLTISEFTNLTVAELSTNKQREALKKELTEKVVKAYTEEDKEYVMAVYFTEFVIQ